MRELITKILGIKYLDISLITAIGSWLAFQSWESSIRFYLGLALLPIGLAIWLMGLIHLGKAFHGLPMAKQLVTTGIYSKFRHPVYVGSIFFFLGLCLCTAHWGVIIFTVLLLFTQVFRAKSEEKKLAEKFGDEYLKYRKRTWL